MKKLLLIISMAITMIACTTKPLTNEQKAQAVVKQHLKENLGDPKSYKPVSFGPLDSVFTELSENEEYIRNYDEYVAYKELTDKWDLKTETERLLRNYESAIYCAETAARFNDSADTYLKRSIVIKDNFKPALKCYRITHEYKASGPLGVAMPVKGVFFIDKEISKVENVTISPF